MRNPGYDHALGAVNGAGGFVLRPNDRIATNAATAMGHERDALPPLSIVMAAGHGTRIKSYRSKMLHEIWGVPAVKLVCCAATEGLGSLHQIVVVGSQMDEVKACLGQIEARQFEIQKERKGTGHAVLTAISHLADHELDRDVYVVPGDKGLLNAETIAALKARFDSREADMMITVGAFVGPIEKNRHGRILRVPAADATGKPPPNEDVGSPIGIVEYPDILAMSETEPHRLRFHGREYAFGRAELLEMREFNASLYAFKGRYLKRLLSELKPDNSQGEIYLTDLLYRFIDAGLSVHAVLAPSDELLMDFNDKAALGRLESLRRRAVYEQLKDLVTFKDEDDFFLADDVVAQLVEMDRSGTFPDLFMGQGAYVGSGVRLSPLVRLGRQAQVRGNVRLAMRVLIGASTQLSTQANQNMAVGEATEILDRNILKGRITIGRRCRIETTVRMTGSDEHPMRVGDNVCIKGTTYLYGCTIDDNVLIQNCYLFNKRIRYRQDASGRPVPVAHIFPKPHGTECVEDG